ncbi:MAG TPA: hypothetical protein VEI03_03450 [Stellaceae bacterium]|nr:hypothetical protein [Stellaceae bacterium]
MLLDEWQARLERHFTELAASHAVTGIPLFALEHDLNKAQLDEIAFLLRERLAADQQLSKHWLLWVIYATELGYAYDGDEYWQSFEEQTPYWRENVDRRWLRAWFQKFQATYKGYLPHGDWAEAFPIICWPITHAILPKYLQFQFAETLYNLRYRLVGLDRASPRQVGKLLSANATGSSRFLAFLQEEELTGRLAMGLLTRKEQDTKSPIYEPTLRRILLDLERIQKTREWMKETRTVVSDHFAGTARQASFFDPRGDFGEEEDGAPQPKNVGIEPTLMMRRSGPELWSVMLEVPDFGSVASFDPEYRDFLRATRCKIIGTGDTWVPASGLLYGAQRRILKNWPSPDRPVIQFERSHKTIDHLLNSECCLTRGANWLCRLGPDGIAREIKGRFVRPGRRYIILTAAPISNPPAFLTPCKTDCSNIHTSYMEVPDKLSEEVLTGLARLDLQVAKTIRIWPAGLSGRGWDGEGRSEWLTTETPCFGIAHDHPVDSYHLSIDNQPSLVIEAGPVGFPVFVKLPPLSPGKHLLYAKAHHDSFDRYPIPELEGFVELRVRDPEPWVPGTTLHSGLTVLLDPPYPTLDAFWEDAVRISVLGPEGRHVSASVSMRSVSGEELSSLQISKHLDLPVTPTTWSKVFRQALEHQHQAWSYLQAASARLSIKAEELGEFIVRLERDVTPVRWVCRHDARKTEVRLVDDTGFDDAPQATQYSFADPTVPAHLSAEKIRYGLEVGGAGGLYVGAHGQYRDSLVVGTSQAIGGFMGLVATPKLKPPSSDPKSLIEIVNWLQLWTEARLTGSLVQIRRLKVTEALTELIYRVLCGPDWCRAEKEVLNRGASEETLQALCKLVGGVSASGFAVILRREAQKLESGTTAGKKWFAGKAAQYNISTDPALCEFALKLASQPQRLCAMYRENLEGFFKQVAANPVLLRGARLVALISATHGSSETGRGMPRWQW